MQFTAVFIKKYIVGDRMSLNDVCCYVPAWFGVLATFFTGLIAYECTLACNCSDNMFAFLWNALSNKHEHDVVSNPTGTSTQTYAPVLSFICAMAAMSVIPAHLMRSVGGGFDNESVAMTAMILTFYLWIRSLRSGEDKSYLWGIATGVAYFYVSTTTTITGYLDFARSLKVHFSLYLSLYFSYRWLQLGGDMSLF
jgi:dolichyl-diphosphooligosaccharide--protein glycosyltransferase